MWNMYIYKHMQCMYFYIRYSIGDLRGQPTILPILQSGGLRGVAKRAVGVAWTR